MGVCYSTKNNTYIKKSDDMELKYDDYLEELRDQKEKDREMIDFEVVGKLIQFYKVKDKEIHSERRYCKYFFINPVTGKIKSKVKSKLGDVDIDGYLERKGKFKITVKYMCAGNLEEKIFEGQLVSTDISLEGKGGVNKVNMNGEITPVEDYTFILDFSTDLWKGNYTLKNNIVDIKAFMKIRLGTESKTLSGMSLDDRGVSLWQGFIQADNKVTLYQSYIGNDVRPKSITFGGSYNPSMNIISGSILNRDGENDNTTQYTITYEKNPKKNSVKK